MSPRPQVDHIRKPQILDAAASVICDRGLHSTRIADVAERAGTSPSAVLYWFASKEELLAQAMLADEERFREHIDRRLAPLGNPAAKLLAVIDACVEDTNWTMWIELWSGAIADRSLRTERETLESRWRRVLEEIVREGVEATIFSTADITEAAVGLSAVIDGLAVQVTLGDPTVTRELMRRTCVVVAERLLSVDLEAAAHVQTAEVAP